jgi:hypothetical protein
MSDLPEFKYGGARALIILHEKELRLFVKAWKQARKVGITLPPVKNHDYESFEQMLYHVVFRARDYMNWICRQLELPDPQLEPIPEIPELMNRIDEYLERLLPQLRKPLVDVPGREFYIKTYTSPWKTAYCIDAMLEHMVMHPIRHRFQLETLMS